MAPFVMKAPDGSLNKKLTPLSLKMRDHVRTPSSGITLLKLKIFSLVNIFCSGSPAGAFVTKLELGRPIIP
jgi:hypothetical protein